MPGPGAKKKTSKTKKPDASVYSESTSQLDSYVADIDTAGYNWNAIIDILCGYFEIPDLTNRHGLKKVHLKFEKLEQRLSKAYQKYSKSSPPHPGIVGGIVGIFAKMASADAILRNKLFEKDFLSKLLPLLDMPDCVLLAVRSLSSVTHHGGIAARRDIAKQSPILVRLLEEMPSDPKVSELVISTLSHSVGTIMCENGPEDLEIMKKLDIRGIILVVTQHMRKPDASLATIDHGMALLANGTLSNGPIYPLASISLLVAGLRSQDWILRCQCLGGIIRLGNTVTDETDELDIMDPQKIIERARRHDGLTGYPDDLVEVMVDYGVNECDTTLTLKATVTNQKAQMKCAQDHDIYALGITLANCIPTTEFSISSGALQTENPVTGQLENCDVGLPWIMWMDSLPHCAQAIRARSPGVASELIMAELLDIKYLIGKHRLPEAIAQSQKALERYPGVAYFYYAMSLTADTVKGLRAAKMGMRCKTITPFLYYQMLQRAATLAGNMGITTLQSAHADDEKAWQEGIAFITSALEDAKAYIYKAPPDNRHQKPMLYWYILLTVVQQGPEFSNIRKFDHAVKTLKVSDQFSSINGVSPPKTTLRLAQQTVLQHFPSAIKDWAHVISRRDSIAKLHSIVRVHDSHEKAEDDLEAWLDNMYDDGVQESKPECIHTMLTETSIEMYRCSWCGNPSAALRRCACGKSRYCDGACQKLAWSDHKRVCTTRHN